MRFQMVDAVVASKVDVLSDTESYQASLIYK